MGFDSLAAAGGPGFWLLGLGLAALALCGSLSEGGHYARAAEGGAVPGCCLDRRGSPLPARAFALYVAMLSGLVYWEVGRLAGHAPAVGLASLVQVRHLPSSPHTSLLR